tara:strand:- start:140 stop:328 length:189 start_codon:yes stop_codon:yes gene_type:complete
MEKEKNIWDNMSNSNIRVKLESLRHEHESIKTKIDLLIDEMKGIELEYLNGNEYLIKRYKGE